DPSDYEAALKRAEANLASRRARLVDEQVRSEQALRDWRNLGRNGEPSDLVLRKPQLQDAEANVQAAEADLQKARRDLQRTRISLPYDGLIREKRVDLGQYVTPGTPLGLSLAIDTAEVRLPLAKDDIPFLDLPEVAEGSDAVFPEVKLTSAEGSSVSQWRARIIRTEGVVDENSRVIYAVAEVPDPYGLLGVSDQPELRFGTFVRAEIAGRDAGRVIVLPRGVLRADGTVLVANDERKLEIRPVEVLRAQPQTIWVGSGLEDGELVVTTTLDAPVPGTDVAIAGDDPRTGEEPVAAESGVAGAQQ
ncbi:MAG: efflux RND transporter periplasmic adaptor subunit, partial [Xanthomonadales bacterium]|nr:efflux RND transporter periplasmic adaptor subunit [Xanthomonadales bacterium]